MNSYRITFFSGETATTISDDQMVYMNRWDDEGRRIELVGSGATEVLQKVREVLPEILDKDDVLRDTCQSVDGPSYIVISDLHRGRILWILPFDLKTRTVVDTTFEGC